MNEKKAFAAAALAIAVAAAAIGAAASDKAHSGAESHEKSAPPRAQPEAKAAVEKSDKHAEEHHVHWSYKGEGGPEEWGRLDANSIKCYLGKAQSPVNIAKTVQKKLPVIAFKYQPGKFDAVNNGHTVQFNQESGSYMELDGKRYDLLQMHFHSPSEHALDGKRFPLEFHFVHKNSDGKLAVIGVMAVAGESNEAYRKLLDNLPMASGEERRNKNIAVNFGNLLPKKRAYVAYSGSLTTPPCSEEVAWHVMSSPVSLSEAQISRIKQTYTENSRPLQKLNGRELATGGQ